MDYARKVAFDHNGPQPAPTPYKIQINNRKFIDLVMRKTRVIFNATILKFSEKFDHPFSHVIIFRIVFHESHDFVAMPVTSCIKDTCSNLSLSN